ncbi:L,D-transpeptidase family protein [Actibacterium sp. 188UL27-1]|nr:L,D-transpeptidase family protein [Actibacterium sp. 188UL27-1]
MAILAALFLPLMAAAEVTAFKQAVAEAAADDRGVAEFYRSNGYQPIFTGQDDQIRRAALIKALNAAEIHGLPAQRYSIDALTTAFTDADTPRSRGYAEVVAAKMFASYARDLQTGVLEPRKVDAGIVREIPRRDPTKLLTDFAKASPDAFLRSLAPQTPEYARLMKEKIRLQQVVSRGDWGAKVNAKALKPGETGPAVVDLRNRLTSIGYMRRSASQTYDASLQKAVQQFQLDHGLESDGVAGASTIAMVNINASTRLEQVMVAMERERWINFPRGQRHILVNITDFSAAIMDDNKVTFRTRSVVGANQGDRRTPEFSDVMEHMVINPTWHVPRSIATKEYLPMFKRNPNAASHLRLIDRRGRAVSRANINFSRYTARNFPYAVKQPPSRRNALGLVKFMFPNKYNIYLHDTPAKKLFAHESRAYSHGCVRLNDPFDFAYALLAKQSDDPVGLFQSKLGTGRETLVKLEQPVPVHLIYRTAFTPAKGRINFRRDIYGRDGRIFDALVSAGVAVNATGS